MGYILAINPGATSTKIGLYTDKGEKVFARTIKHNNEDFTKEHYLQQYEIRKKIIEDVLKEEGVNLNELVATVGRGGPVKPMKSGTYRVNDKMINDVKNGNVMAEHISNIGCLIADEIARPLGIPAFIVDPVSVDEFDDVARLSGIPELERQSLSHALNMKMVAKKLAKEVGKKYEDLNLIVIHLGTGISVSAHHKGRMIDVNNANDEGPYSPQRVGTLPTTGLVKLCYSGKYTQKELMKYLLKEGGLKAYTGTDDVLELINKSKDGDKKSELYLDGMIYQVSKTAGGMAAVLKGNVDYIIITGGISQSEYITDRIKERLSFIAPIKIYPGEDEIEALVLGVIRVLNKEEEEKEYE